MPPSLYVAYLEQTLQGYQKHRNPFNWSHPVLYRHYMYLQVFSRTIHTGPLISQHTFRNNQWAHSLGQMHSYPWKSVQNTPAPSQLGCKVHKLQSFSEFPMYIQTLDHPWHTVGAIYHLLILVSPLSHFRLPDFPCGSLHLSKN